MPVEYEESDEAELYILALDGTRSHMTAIIPLIYCKGTWEQAGVQRSGLLLRLRKDANGFIRRISVAVIGRGLNDARQLLKRWLRRPAKMG
jgi:hypothetical protein